ncbi:MAG: metallophosphoesterase [Deltaproteobacteria bacterium]|nr:metallophosphoesterase [Deltaproteobacteria bacterium]
MCGKMFKSLSLILVLMFQLNLAGCGGSDKADPNFEVVVFTDVHFNPFYDESLFQQLNNSDSSQWAAIFQSSNITTPSTWGTDTNYPLLALALANVQLNLGTSAFVIFTGDILGHYLPQTFFRLYDPENAEKPTVADIEAMKAFTDKTVAFFMEQVRSAVGDIPVLFALGNADSYTGLGPDSSFLSNTAELYYTNFLNGAVDHQTFLDTYTSGGYYAAEPDGENLMVIALNTFECSPVFGDDATDAVNAQLVWLDETLASAQSKGKKVWLIMHVPPGVDKYSTAQSADANGHITSATMLWNSVYQATFLQKLRKYPELITHSLGAHTHMDEYRVMSSGDVMDITPGITPYFGNDPAFKVFTFSHETLKAMDYTSLNYDLGAMPPQFDIYYTFSTAYRMQGDLNDSLEQLYQELVTDNTKQAFYRGSCFSGHNYTTPVGSAFYPITDSTWPIYWAGIGEMDEQDFIYSVNSY